MSPVRVRSEPRTSPIHIALANCTGLRWKTANKRVVINTGYHLPYFPLQQLNRIPRNTSSSRTGPIRPTYRKWAGVLALFKIRLCSSAVICPNVLCAIWGNRKKRTRCAIHRPIPVMAENRTICKPFLSPASFFPAAWGRWERKIHIKTTCAPAWAAYVIPARNPYPAEAKKA